MSSMKKPLILLTLLLSFTFSSSCQAQQNVSKQSEAFIKKRLTNIYANVFSKKCVRDPEYHFTSKEYYALYRSLRNMEGRLGDLIMLDYDHWSQSQDPYNPTMTISSVTIESKKKASAIVYINNGGNPTKVKLVLVFEGGNWYIDDFITFSQYGGSEKTMIKAYFK